MSRRTNTADFNEIVDYGVDFINRRIYFGVFTNDIAESGGDFYWSSVEIAVRAIHHMENECSSKPIELHMNSYGGSINDMLKLYDTIQNANCQIKFFGSGSVMSAATWIMAGCDERYLTPNTQILIHEWRGGISADTKTDIKVEMYQRNNFLTKTLNQIYADNSRLPIEFWEEVTKRDLHLTPEEAILLGIADEIVLHKKRGSLRRKRIAHMNSKINSDDLSKLMCSINNRLYRGKDLKIEVCIPEEKYEHKLL